MFEGGETVEFVGMAIAHLASDDAKKLMTKSGKILWTSNISKEYGFTDIDGRVPDDWRSLKYLLRYNGYTNLASIFPSFVRIPMFVVHFASYKF